MRISLNEVLNAVRSRQAAITAEAGAYVVLLAVRQLQGSWGRVEPTDLEVTVEGKLELPTDRKGPREECERGLREILGQLLAECRAPSPALLALVTGGGEAGSSNLESELLAALVPLNESAARRGLARLRRETARTAGVVLRGAERIQSDAAVGPTTPTAPAAEKPTLARPIRSPEQLPLFETERPAVVGVAAESSEQQGVEAEEVGVPSSRSDLGALLGGFLSESRSEERMTQELRRAIGID